MTEHDDGVPWAMEKLESQRSHRPAPDPTFVAIVQALVDRCSDPTTDGKVLGSAWDVLLEMILEDKDLVRSDLGLATVQWIFAMVAIMRLAPDLDPMHPDMMLASDHMMRVKDELKKCTHRDVH